MKKKKKGPLVAVLVLIVIVVAIVAIISILSGEPADPAEPTAAQDDAPKTDPAPASDPEPGSELLASNDFIDVSFERLYEESGIQGVAYLQLAITNKSDRELWVYLDRGAVNDEQLSTFLSGVPTYIMPGKTSSNPAIISYSQLTIESVDEIRTVEFDIVIADRESLSEISRISGVKITP
jgi:hypothetical protein